jgi:hypothetical protein
MMSPFEKTLYLQRLIYQLQSERKNTNRDKETDSLITMYEVNAAHDLDNAIENLQEALTVMGFFPVIKER